MDLDLFDFSDCYNWEAMVVTDRVSVDKCKGQLGAAVGAICLDDFHRHPNTYIDDQTLTLVRKMRGAALLITSCGCDVIEDRYEAACWLQNDGRCASDSHTHTPLVGHSYDRLEYRRVLTFDDDVLRKWPDSDDFTAGMSLARAMFNLRRLTGSYGTRSIGLVTTEPEILSVAERLPPEGKLSAYLLETVREQRKRECEQVQSERRMLVEARSKYKEAKALVSTRLRGMSPVKASPTQRIFAS